MSILKNIAEYVQNAAEIINETTSADVEIVDSNLVRVGAAGSLGKQLNRAVNFGTTTREVLVDPKTIIVESKNNHFCSICPGRNLCPYYGGIVAPMLHNNKAIGVINILGYHQEEMDSLIKNQQRLFSLINKVTNMISVKLKEIETELTLRKVKDYFPYGLIKLNAEGIIQSTNNEANRLISTDGKLSGKSLIEVLGGNLHLPVNPDLPVEIESKINEYKERLSRNFNHIDIKIDSIMQKDNLLGYIVILRRKKNDGANNLPTPNQSFYFDRIMGESPVIKDLKERTARFANSNSTILLEGESGTGKELVAEAIHYNSSRSVKPLIPINASAIPESLVESELFGYEKNTFTGADKDGKIGIFEAADGGTVFIDEVATIPLYLQRKLLRFLENREIFRVGSMKPKKLDIRIITATNEDLKKLIKEGKFRKDLYYRLNVVSLRIPVLREREQDILILAEHFLNKFCEEENKEVVFLSQHTKNLLLQHAWEGNIRELKNAMEYAIHDLEGSNEITMDNLPPYIIEDLAANEAFSDNKDEKNPESVDQYERKLLHSLMKEVKAGKKTMIHVADILGISRATLYRRIKRYNF